MARRWRMSFSKTIGSRNPLCFEDARVLAGIETMVCREWSVSFDEIRGPRRTAELVRARHAAMVLGRSYTHATLPQLGRWFRRDHTTVLHALRTCKARERNDAEFGTALHAMRLAVEESGLARKGDDTGPASHAEIMMREAARAAGGFDA